MKAGGNSPFIRPDGSIRVERPVKRTQHILLNSLGILFVLLGIVGMVLPVLPTTVFFIIASGLFIRSNPVMYRWLHRNRVTGSYLRVYTSGEGMSRSSKAWTIGILWASLLLSGWLVRERLWLLLLLAAVGIGVTWHVATIGPRKISAERLARHRRMMGLDEDPVSVPGDTGTGTGHEEQSSSRGAAGA